MSSEVFVGNDDLAGPAPGPDADDVTQALDLDNPTSTRREVNWLIGLIGRPPGLARLGDPGADNLNWVASDVHAGPDDDLNRIALRWPSPVLPVPRW